MQEKSIGEKIREYRQKQGLTQDALAAELHISSQAISKWENGQTMPDISLLVPLSKVLKTSVNDLLGGDRRRELEKRWHEAEDLDEEMALLAIDDALIEFPDDEEFLYHRAKYELVLGLRDKELSSYNGFLAEAAMHLEELVERFPDNDEYKNLLARTYFYSDQKDRAMKAAYSMRSGRDSLIEEFSEGDAKRRLRQRRMKNMTSGLLTQLKKYNTRESLEAAYGLIGTMMGDDILLRSHHLWTLCVSDALLSLEEGDPDRYVAKLTEAYEIAKSYDLLPRQKHDYTAPLFDMMSVDTCNRYPPETQGLIERFLSEPKLCLPESLPLRRRIADECFGYPRLAEFRWKNYYRFCRKYICKGNFFNFGTAWHVPEDEEREKYNSLKGIRRRGSVALHEIHKDEIEKYVKSGIMSGFTAMYHEMMIGFCHCGRKEKFARIALPDEERAIPTAPEGSKVLSIVEIMIADAFKGCGVEEKMIRAALDDAKNRGYTHAETYLMEWMFADSEKKHFYELFAVYQKLGFKIIRDLSGERQGHYFVMQKVLLEPKEPKKYENPQEEYKSVLNELETRGYEIETAASEREEIGKTYGIDFPRALSDFFACGMPVGKDPRSDFPLWRDMSDENVSLIKRRLRAPLKNLKDSVKDGFWIEEWGERPKDEDEAVAKFSEIADNAPMLIPVYGHRYIPVIEGVDDPPVISVVGSDIIYYGCNLVDYLRREFLGKKGAIERENITRIPFWSDIIDQNW